jgi:ubiquinone/menaquinone biosynthesis C-methylase UbiE
MRRYSMATNAGTDPELEAARDAALATWEAMAPGWDRRREFLRNFSQPVTDWMVRELDAQAGETILELAAGTGEIGFEAAGTIGDTGRLITTDFASGMVEVARRRARERGVSNVEFRVLDATQNGLASGSVDGILCRWGYMLMPDAPAALAESRRVLRPGGRLVLSVMGGPAENPWAAGVSRALVELGLTPPMDPKAPGGLFSLSDPDELRRLLGEAGFRDVRIEEIEFLFVFSDFGDYWDFVLEFAGAVAMLLNSLTEEQRSAVRDATEKGAGAFRTERGYDIPGLALNAIAT